MTFHYPNGIPYNHHEAQSPKKQVKKKRPVEFGNRGMDFEEAINQSNQYYLLNKQAVVHKKPTPVQIVKVDYPKRSAAVIKEAYFRQASTTDYNGVYQGICFVLLWFSSLKRCFFFSGENLITHWKNQAVTGKKSMPLALIEKEGIELSFGIAPRIPYLDAVEQYIQTH